MTTQAQQYTVDPDQLRTHANKLSGRADQLSSLGKALPNEMNPQSLGMIAQFITTAISGAMAATMEAFEHASSTTDKVGQGMRTAADNYDRAEDDHGSQLAGIGTELEGVAR